MSHMPHLPGVTRRRMANAVAALGAVAFTLVIFVFSQQAYSAAPTGGAALPDGWTELDAAPRGDAWAVAGPAGPYRAVAFGGQDGVAGNDALVYDGATWRRLELATGDRPAPRRGSALVAGDAGRILLYGGRSDDPDAEAPLLGDLWELRIGADGRGAWRDVTPAVGPQPMERPSLALGKMDPITGGGDPRLPFYLLYGTGSGQRETWLLEWTRDTYAYSWREFDALDYGQPALPDAQVGTRLVVHEDGAYFAPTLIGPYADPGVDPYQVLYSFMTDRLDPPGGEWLPQGTVGSLPTAVDRPVVVSSTDGEHLLLLDGGGAPGASLRAWVLRSLPLKTGQWEQVTAPAGLTAVANPAVFYDAPAGRYLLINGAGGRQWALTGLGEGETPTWAEEPAGASGAHPQVSAMVYAEPPAGPAGVYGFAQGAIWRHDGAYWSPVGGPAGASLAAARLVYAPDSRLIYLIGMAADPAKPAAVWSFDGQSWAALTYAGGPSSAYADGFHAAYDPARGQIVVFGGATTGGQIQGDAWLLRPGQGWLAVDLGPQARRAGGAFVWDSARGQGVLFGGVDASGLAAGTWLLTPVDGGGYAWSQAAGANPPLRTGAGATFDSQRGRVVLFGGASADRAADQNTVWEFDTAWSFRNLTAPISRYGHAMAFVPGAAPYTLMAGGALPGGLALSDTWAYRSADPGAPPTTSPTAPTAEPTVDPTEPPVPTVGPLPSQGFFDNGVVRIWADSFTMEPDAVTVRASGHVIVGAQLDGDEGKYFSVGESARWKPNGPIELAGRVAYLQGDQGLAQGTFTVAQDTGVMSWPEGTVPLYTTLGSSDLTITPTLTVNVVQTEVRAVTAFALDLPEEQTLRLNLDLTLKPDGSVTTSAAVPIALKLAGGTLTADVTVDRLGLTAPKAQLKLPSLGTTITLDKLRIHGHGENKLSFNGSSVFPLPDIPLTSSFSLKNITGTLGVVVADAKPKGYRLGLAVGSVRLANLPLKSGASVANAEFLIQNGKVYGDIARLTLVMAGKDMPLKNLKFNGGKKAADETQGLAATLAGDQLAVLVAERTEIPMPDKWAIPGFEAPKIIVEDVRIYDEFPFVRFGAAGAHVALPPSQAYYLAGDPDATVKVRFDQIEADLVARNQKLELDLTSQLTIAAGTDNSTSAKVKLNFSDGGVKGNLDNASLMVAGLQVSAATLDYSDDAFTAATATITLPGSLGGNAITLKNLRITADGIYIDESGGVFNVPDRDLGPVLQLTRTSGQIDLDGKGGFRVKLSTTLNVRNIEAIGGGNSIATGGTLLIQKGRVTGTVSEFGFRVAGLGFHVDQPRFLDNRITARSVDVALPESLGGGSTALFNLEIGGAKGFSVGGGSFRLPDFSIGKVGVQNVQGEFYRTPEGPYSIAGRARFNFEAFSVDGSFKLQYITQPPELRLQQVKLAFYGSVLGGTAIPIGDTGLYITRVTGEFDLSSGTLELRFGLKVASAATIDLPIAGETPIVGAEGEVYVKARPFELRTQAETQLVGLSVNEVDVRLTATSFTLTAKTEWQVARSLLRIAFGKESDGGLTFYGQAETEIGIRRGSIGCIAIACLPPVDFTLERRGYDFGKFRHDGRKVYGVRAYGSAFGVDFYAFARVAPTMGVDVGTNLDAYEAALPAFAPSATAQAAPTYDVDVTAPATQLVVLEAVAEANRAAPQDVTVTGPAGASFVKKLQYQSAGGDTRIYTVDLTSPEQAVGLWRLTPQQGNQLKVWGADPPARAARFEAAVEGGAVLTPAAQQPTPRVTLGGGETLSVAWTAANDEPGLELQVYAENSQGVRFPIASQASESEASLSGTRRWPLALPSGTYTITLAIDDGRNVSTYARMEPIVVEDTAGPAAPAGLRAEARADGSVRLSWDGPAPAADHLGYQVRVNGGEPISQRGAQPSLEVFGLAPGGRYTLAVAAYDLSGNVGPEASVGVSMPAFAVSATQPRRGEALEAVGEVSLSLAEPAADVALSVLDGRGEPVAGAAEPVLAEVAPDELAVMGARFAPEGGALAPGAYTARAVVKDAAGAAHELSWPFTVVAPAAPTTAAALSPAPVNGWYRNPTVTLTASGAEVAKTEYRLDGGPWTAYAGPFQLTGDGERTLEYRSAGAAGQLEEVKTLRLKNDATPPALAPSVAPSPVLLNGSATAAPNASDAGSGVAAASCGAVDTKVAGSFTVSCSATDQAGNQATASTKYTVGYSFRGFLAPVDNPPTVNTGRAGRTYPVKWQLTDAAGRYVGDLRAVQRITLRSVQCGTLGPNPTSSLEIMTSGSTSLRYDSGANQYIYNWASPSSAGCYSLQVTLKSGQSFQAYFSLRR